MEFMKLILKILGDWTSWVIIICGIVEVIALIRNASSISKKKDRIAELLTRRNRKYHKNKDTGELDESDDADAAVTPDTIRAAEKEFNAVCSWHNVWAQLIPIFPLLGVLGTVYGLMMQVSAADIEQMLGSLDVALGTTFLGLIFAIFLKAFDAIYPSRIISDAEVLLDDFDKKMELRED